MVWITTFCRSPEPSVFLFPETDVVLPKTKKMSKGSRWRLPFAKQLIFCALFHDKEDAINHFFARTNSYHIRTRINTADVNNVFFLSAVVARKNFGACQT